MVELLIFIYIIENIYLVWKSYKENEGIFSPIFIASIMSLGQLLPQLTTIYSLPMVYNPVIVPPLVTTMILCNWAFYKGWKKKIRRRAASRVLEFKSSYYKPMTFLFSLGAVIFTQIIKVGSAIIDGVIAFQFQGVGFIGLIMAILYLKNHKIDKIILLSLIMSTFSILEYALTIYGSRQSVFTTVLLYIYLFWYKFPNKRQILKKSFLTFFIVGCIGSLSIVEVRNSLNNNSGMYSNFGNIDFIENLKKSFTNSYSELAGMDLGNCAVLMDECYRTSEFNYGLFLWNGFVFNYVPKRIVGEESKESLMFSGDASLRSKAKQVTHDITCTTGYFDAYSSFWYLGFVLFGLLGYIFRYLKSISTTSSFYEVIFLFALVNSSVGMTHGLQLIVSKFEFIALLFLLLFFTLNHETFNYKKK